MQNKTKIICFSPQSIIFSIYVAHCLVDRVADVQRDVQAFLHTTQCAHCVHCTVVFGALFRLIPLHSLFVFLFDVARISYRSVASILCCEQPIQFPRPELRDQVQKTGRFCAFVCSPSIAWVNEFIDEMNENALLFIWGFPSIVRHASPSMVAFVDAQHGVILFVFFCTFYLCLIVVCLRPITTPFQIHVVYC